MAEAVMPERSGEPSSHVEEALPRLDRPKAVHGGRFMIGYVVIVVMAGAALLTVGLMTRGDSGSSTAAVGGIPIEDNGFQRAREVATEVARHYRGANGEQIVAVTAQPGEVSGLPLQYIAMRHGRNRPLTQGDVTVVEPGETALFSFCGLGGQQNCALPGQPSPERLMLMRREAVELSYYAFQFLPELKTVVSLLPPVPREGQPPQTFAVYFQRQHLESILDKPFTRTLPERPPFSEGDIAPGEAETVNRLTETR